MKKVFILLIAVSFLFNGCAFLNEYVATDTGERIVKKAGRLAGIVTGFEKPEDVDKMISYCDDLLKEKSALLKEAALQKAYKYIYKRYGKNAKTVTIMAEISDILNIIVKDDVLLFPPEWDFTATDIFITAFRDGLILTK